MPSISVIVPVYNVEKYIHRCVDSILAQTFTGFELILIDDGSLDRCGEICDGYAAKDSRVRVIHKKNEGVSAARNTGLETVSGEYVTFVDSDDYIRENWLADLYSAVISQTADLSCGNFSLVDEQGKRIYTTNHILTDYDLSDERKKADYLIKYFFDWHRNGWNIWDRLFRADIIRNQHIRFNLRCGNYAEDMCFVLEYLLFCRKITYIPANGYYYVQHDNSMMDRSKKQLRIDSANEVSRQFGTRFFAIIKDRRIKNLFPVLHFLILNQEYTKVFPHVDCEKLDAAICALQSPEWYRKYTAALWKNTGCLCKKYGKRKAGYFIQFSHFCVTRHWKLYTLVRNAYHFLLGEK